MDNIFEIIVAIVFVVVSVLSEAAKKKKEVILTPLSHIFIVPFASHCLSLHPLPFPPPPPPPPGRGGRE